MAVAPGDEAYSGKGYRRRGGRFCAGQRKGRNAVAGLSDTPFRRGDSMEPTLNEGDGLAPLPAWVRRLDRVTLWVMAMIVLYHARLLLREERRRAA